MPQNTVIRFGQTIGVNEPEPTPDELRAFEWPAKIIALLDKADEAWRTVDTACEDWRSAHDYLENGAGEADKQLLLASLRKGEGDPGTPTQDAAKRDEEVKWAQYQIAREDAGKPDVEAQNAIRAYLAEHLAELATHELKMIDVALKAKERADDAMDKAQQAARSVGVHYVTARYYTGERLAPEPFMLPRELQDMRPGDVNALQARYEAMRDNKPTPYTDGNK